MLAYYSALGITNLLVSDALFDGILRRWDDQTVGRLYGSLHAAWPCKAKAMFHSLPSRR